MPLDLSLITLDEVPAEIIDLDDALEKLAMESPEKATLVNLRFFAGLTLRNRQPFSASLMRLLIDTGHTPALGCITRFSGLIEKYFIFHEGFHLLFTHCYVERR